MRSDYLKIEWHVPTPEEIDYALRIFSEIIDPAMMTISRLLSERKCFAFVLQSNLTVLPANFQDIIWRNDYCRNLSIINYAFSGMAQFVQELRDPQTLQHMFETSDLA